MSSSMPAADGDIVDDDFEYPRYPQFDPGYDHQAASRAAMPTPKRRPRRTEAETTKLALSWLRAQPGTYAWKLHTGAYGESGHPDIDGCVNGRSIKIEMKEPGHRPTPQQMARLTTWRAAGALVGWATSLADVQAIYAHASDFEWCNPLTGPGDGATRTLE